MKRATTTSMGLVALVVMLVLGVFSAGSASAHEFLSTGPLPPLILALSDNAQVFEVVPGGLFSVSCKHFGGHGVGLTKSMLDTEQIITGRYTKCTIVASGNTATVSPVEYLITADGLVSILKPISIHVNIAECTVKVFSGAENSANSRLEKLLFSNHANGTILVHSDISGIHSVGTGGQCGEPTVEHTEGTYSGLFHTWIDGGTIEWE